MSVKVRFHYSDGTVGTWQRHGRFWGLLRRGFAVEYHSGSIRVGDHLIVEDEPDMDDPDFEIDEIVVVTKIETR